jgi:hypothetical protein
MSSETQDDSSLKGPQSENKHPDSGYPAEPAPMPAAPGVLAVAPGSTTTDSPEVPAPPPDHAPAAPPTSETPAPAPRDLSPEEAITLIPGSESEREASVAAADGSSAITALPAASAPMSPAAASALAVEAQPASPAAPPLPGSRDATSSRGAGASPEHAEPPPAASPGTIALRSATASAGKQPPPGMRTLSADASGASAAVLFDLRRDDIARPAYSPGEVLTANPELVKIFVPDVRLTTLWLDIDTVEKDVTATKGMREALADEMLDRLMKARNLLMNDRAHYEEAARQVAQVKYHLASLRSSSFLQSPVFISWYLLVFLALVVAGVPFSRTIAWDQLQIVNLKLDMLWYTMLVGGVGGFTGAAYSLVSHEARDRDYDPQFALWYYLNPWMGLVLGIFVYIAVFILMNIGSLMVNGQTTSGSPVLVLTTFFFAWAAGFKHNIAFDLADTVLKKLIPAPDDDASATPDTTVTPAAHK